MELADIVSFVSNVGFPMLACVYLARSNQKLNEQHKIEMDELRKSIQQNTRAIDALTTYIRKGE